jgi:hypothetical protein
MNSLPITIERYREIMNDKVTSDKLIPERINYLTAFCESIIDSELEKYSSKEKS